MGYLTGLETALRNGRIGYWASPGWHGRGHGGMSGVRAIMIHHTAGGGRNDWLTVQNGRPGLSGPLAHMTLERDGGVRLLAAGLCYHAGLGSHPRVGTNNGNAWCIGIEGVSDGVGGDAWTAAQRREYPRVAAALCRHYRLPAEAVIGHKEWAPGRKINPGEWDMNHFRAEVRRHLNGAPAPTRTPGGIESMAFTDKYRDWAGNEQTVGSWMNNVDRRVYEVTRDVNKLVALFGEYFEKQFEVQLPGRVETNTNTGFIRSARGAIGRLQEDTREISAIRETVENLAADLADLKAQHDAPKA